MSAGLLRLTEEEIDGDLPMVCARTGNPAAGLAPVWFARSSWWAWLPLGVLSVWAVLTADWAPLAAWWTAGALVLPLVTSRGMVGRVPLDHTTQARLSNLRRRRFRFLAAALLLTWVAVALHLLGSRAAGVLVLAVVVGLYVTALGMFVAARTITIRGWPEDDGGATLRDVHPDFIDAVVLRRTGHRP